MIITIDDFVTLIVMIYQNSAIDIQRISVIRIS